MSHELSGEAMVISDAERHRLHGKLDVVLGEEDSAVLMEHLPPSGWSDVARTRDLDVLRREMAALEQRIDLRFEAVDARLDTMEARFEASLERALREQTTRFLVMNGALITLLLSLQQVLGHLAS